MQPAGMMEKRVKLTGVLGIEHIDPAGLADQRVAPTGNLAGAGFLRPGNDPRLGPRHAFIVTARKSDMLVAGQVGVIVFHGTLRPDRH